jgi:hypothetical protein
MAQKSTHLVTNEMLLVNVRKYAYCQVFRLFDVIHTDFQFSGTLFVCFLERCIQALLYHLTHLTLSQLLRALHWGFRRHTNLHPFRLFQITLRTSVASIGLVCATVEESTDLVSPQTTIVAVHPSFFRQRIVFELLQVFLLQLSSVIKDDRLVGFQVIKTLVAPVTLFILIGKIRCVSLDTLHPALTSAVQHRRLETKIAHSTQRTQLSLTFEISMRRFNVWWHGRKDSK